MNSNSEWPPEIDILEVLTNDPTTLHCTFHWGVLPEHKQFSPHVQPLPDLSADFHNYGVEWTPDSISWFFDGQKMGESFIQAGNISQCQAMYIIINTAVGGWALNPDSTTLWPSYLQCDWVKVWQLLN